MVRPQFTELRNLHVNTINLEDDGVDNVYSTEISAEEAESYMKLDVADDEGEKPPCCEYSTEWDEQWHCNMCQVCGSKR